MSTKKVHQGDKKRNCGWPRHFDMGKHKRLELLPQPPFKFRVELARDVRKEFTHERRERKKVCFHYRGEPRRRFRLTAEIDTITPTPTKLTISGGSVDSSPDP